MQELWDRVFTESPTRFGSAPSTSAEIAKEHFPQPVDDAIDILDLGSGSGRAQCMQRRSREAIEG